MNVDETSRTLRDEGGPRLDFPPATWLLGVAGGAVAGLALVAGGGLWLALVLLAALAIAVTASRPDLAVSMVVLVLPFLGERAIVYLPGVPDVTVGRLIVPWALVVVAVAIRAQRRRDREAVDQDAPADLLRGQLPIWVYVFLALMLVAAGRSPVLRTGLQGWLDAYLLPFVALLVVSRYRWSRHEVDTVVLAYLTACCAWSALALFEFVTKRSLFTADGVLPWASGGTPFGRTGGPFINPAFLGTTLGIGFVLAWVWASRHGRGRRLALLCMPLSAAGLTASLTRASWLGAAAGFLVVLAMARHRRVVTSLIATSAIALAVLLIVSLFGAGFLEQRTSSRSEVFNRLVVQGAAVRMIEDHPLAGVGSDRFHLLLPQYLRSVGSISGAFGAAVAVPHNSVLDVTVDGGLLAGASLVVVIGLLFTTGRRRLADDRERYRGVAALAILVVFVVNAMFMDVSLGTAVTTLALILVGVLLATRDQSYVPAR